MTCSGGRAIYMRKKANDSLFFWAACCLLPVAQPGQEDAVSLSGERQHARPTCTSSHSSRVRQEAGNSGGPFVHTRRAPRKGQPARSVSPDQPAIEGQRTGEASARLDPPSPTLRAEAEPADTGKVSDISKRLSRRQLAQMAQALSLVVPPSRKGLGRHVHHMVHPLGAPPRCP
jgi:hypothetical protein